MPWPTTPFAEFLRQRISENKGKKPPFKKWSFSTPRTLVEPQYEDEPYVPGTYGYVPRLKETLRLPEYAEPQQPPLSTQIPDTFQRGGDVPLSSTMAGSDLPRVMPDYKDRMEQWQNTDYRLQFDDQNNMVEGIGVPNPQGDTLDKYPGALGWDFNGNPYYGTGIGGFWNKLSSQIKHPYGIPDDYVQELTTGGGKRPTREAEDYRYSGTGFGALGRGVQAGVGGLISAFGAAAKGTEQTYGIPLAVAGFGEEGYQVPGVGEVEPESVASQKETLFEGVKQETPVEGLPWNSVDLGQLWRNYVDNFGDYWRQNMYRSPVSLAYNLGRNLIYKTPQELGEDLAEGWQSGRIAYTAFVDPAVREEFVRRMKAGENPDLLQQELENPWAEIAGQMVLDPLNFVGLGVAKDVRNALRHRSAVRRMFGISDEVEDILRTAEKSGVTKLSDIRIAEKTDELVGAVSRDFTQQLQKRVKWAKDYRPWQLTASGKRNEMARDMGEWVGRVIADTPDDSDVVDILRAMYQTAFGAANGNKDMVATGLTGINKLSQPRMGLSQTGQDVGNMLYNLLGDDPGKFFDVIAAKAEKGTPELIEWMGKTMDAALNKTVPDVSKLPADQVPFYARAVSKFHNEGAMKVYRPINSFFAGVYMGANPGYAFRNWFNNVFTAGIDEGFGNVITRPEAAMADLRLWLKDIIPGGVGGFSGGVQGMEIGETGKRVLSKKWSSSAAANQMELNSSVQVVHAAVKREMRRMMQPGRAIPYVDELIGTGMERETAEQLYGLAMKHHGDIDAAAMEFAQKIKTGDMWALDTLNWLSDKEQKVLSDIGIENEFTRIANEVRERGGTADDAISEIQSKWDDVIRQYEDNLRDMPPVVDEDAEGVEVVNSLMQARNVGDNVDYLDNAIYYTQANHNDMAAYRKALDNKLPPEFDKAARRLGVDQNRRSQHAAQLRDLSFSDDFDIERAWRSQLGLTSEVPLDAKEFRNRMWREYFFEPMRDAWQKQRDSIQQFAEQAFNESGGNLNPGLFAEARKHHEYALQWDDMMRRDEIRIGLNKALNRGDSTNAAQILGEWLQGSENITGDRHLLNAINKYLPEGTEKYKLLREIPIEDLKAGGLVEDSLMRRLRVKAGVEPEPGAVKAVGEAATAAPPIAPAASAIFPKPDYLTDPRLESAYDAFVDALRSGSPERVDKLVELRRVISETDLPSSQVESIYEDINRTIKSVRDLENVTLPPPIAPAASNAPSMSRGIFEQKDGIQDFLNTVFDKMRSQWGTYHPAQDNKQIATALENWRKTGNTRMTEARLIAQEVGNAARDFTLLNYEGKRYFDLALAYVMPYHFWYNRSYAHWLQRLAWNPEVIAGYSKYKEFLGKIHAGAPEWWKYNINTNELFGLDSENPLFFNLEQTLWPLNGLTGVDFDDPHRRVNWWTAFVDDLGKLGPTVWTPIMMATALGLQAKGEAEQDKILSDRYLEASQRFGGRLFPQTAFLKSALSAANINIKFGGGINEFDPMVQLFSNGQDPYERRRVPRAMAKMVEEGLITQEQMIEAAKNQSGPFWDEGTKRAIRDRAFGGLSSFAFGTGFKARSETDMQIDMFDQEWRTLWAKADGLSPEEIRIKMDELRDKYPWGDAVILSRKTGLDRDRSYAYNVLSRIPPGQKSDLAELVQISPDLFDKFYSDKGRMDKWAGPDYGKFMAAMVEIGSVLDLPDTATRQEWTAAKNAYDTLNKQIADEYGEEMNQRIDIFYGLRRNDREASDQYLADNPDVQEAMDYKEQQLVYDPNLAPYYAGVDKIENYYRSRMWDAIEREIPKFSEHMEKWKEIRFTDQKAANAYWDKHLGKRYTILRDYYRGAAADATTKVAQALQDARFPNLNPNAVESIGAQNLLEQLGSPAQTPYQYTWDDWSTAVPSRPLKNLLIDYFQGQELSYNVRQEVERIADGMDIDMDVMLQLMEQSYYGQQ